MIARFHLKVAYIKQKYGDNLRYHRIRLYLIFDKFFEFLEFYFITESIMPKNASGEAKSIRVPFKKSVGVPGTSLSCASCESARTLLI